MPHERPYCLSRSPSGAEPPPFLAKRKGEGFKTPPSPFLAQKGVVSKPHHPPPAFGPKGRGFETPPPSDQKEGGFRDPPRLCGQKRRGVSKPPPSPFLAQREEFRKPPLLAQRRGSFETPPFRPKGEGVSTHTPLPPPLQTKGGGIFRHPPLPLQAPALGPRPSLSPPWTRTSKQP